MSRNKHNQNKHQAVPCRVRTNSNFMGVINRATLRAAVHPHHAAGGLSEPQRGTCLNSGSLDTRVAKYRDTHGPEAQNMIYKREKVGTILKSLLFKR
jgi:hypothetical protein